jgi:DNA-binding transcriptional LysR family regulator
MHIENFKVFADLVDTTSFSATGKMNDLSQSAVSQQLRAMETHFDVHILDRTLKRFHLTREGEELYKAARDILRPYYEITNRIKEMNARIDGVVRISAIHSIGLYELPDVLKRFLAAYDTVDFRVEYRRSNIVLEDVAHNAADLGLIAYPEPMKHLDTIPFAEDQLIVVCSPRHPFAAKKDISLADLSGQRFIGFDQDIPTRKAVDQLLRDKGVEVNAVMETDNVETLKRAVEAEVGLALVPSSTIRQEAAQGTLVGLPIKDCRINRPLAVVHRPGFLLTPAMKLFIQMLSEATGGNGTTSVAGTGNDNANTGGNGNAGVSAVNNNAAAAAHR